jgi:hypothetical protein
MQLCCSILTWPDFAQFKFEFRRGGVDQLKPVEFELPEIDEALRGIRCPLCKWHPSRSSLWMCWDCDYPEYFNNGCGTEWNTFETRGLCPTCLHQWVWTSCLSCWGWSRHEDWYADDELTSGR